ncbi:MAG TPA: SDR family oxidoreductase [Gemmatimonadales bacterium]|nr:SDR family oxidoreductase [Gemmatimonadales bacterium]
MTDQRVTAQPRPLALVTGASAGIGREFSEQLAARGYDLLIVARDAARLDAFARQLATRHGIVAHAISADLSLDDGVSRLIDEIRVRGPLAVLVNNAGFGTNGPLATAPTESQEAMLRLHVLAPMRLTQAVLPAMLERGAGWLINVSSIAGFTSAAGRVNYCATKAYLTNFSEGLAAELAGSGVRVQALCPGFTHTEFHHRMGFDKSEIPPRLWLDAGAVVRASLAAIERGGPVVCVPGARYKLIVLLLRVLPARWRMRLAWLAARRRAGAGPERARTAV